MRSKNSYQAEGVVVKTRITGTIMIVLFLCIVLVFSIMCGIIFGSSELSVSSVLNVLKSKLFGIAVEDVPSSAFYIVWNLRLPRVLLALAAGGGLAVCGAAMQAVTQNVLADPYILGVSSGASVMVSLAFFLNGVLIVSRAAISGFAFVGALFSMLLVFAIGGIGKVSSGSRLVLSGMAINIMLTAISQFFITLSTEHATRNITLWMMGSVSGGRWNNIALPISVSILGLILLLLRARAYNLISLGDETAISMGVKPSNLKRFTAVTVAIVTGIIVSNCGLIGLVGFVIPHIVRLISGPDHRRLIPVSFYAGAIFLVWMDMLARYVMAPAELPIGIFTAMCGAPFFIMLLAKQSKEERRGE